MACFGKRHGMLHGFAVPDFTHQDHIGGLAKRVLEGHVPAVCVQPHLTLGDDAVLVWVHKLHRVFHGDDVTIRVDVTPVDHGSQAGGFARTRSTHKDHQAALDHGDLFQHLWQAHVIDGWQLVGNHPHDQTDLALLYKGIDAESPDSRGRNRKVALFGVLKLCCLLVTHD